jgi:hypothetical protein
MFGHILVPLRPKNRHFFNCRYLQFGFLEWLLKTYLYLSIRIPANPIKSHNRHVDRVGHTIQVPLQPRCTQYMLLPSQLLGHWPAPPLGSFTFLRTMMLLMSFYTETEIDIDMYIYIHIMYVYCICICIHIYMIYIYMCVWSIINENNIICTLIHKMFHSDPWSLLQATPSKMPWIIPSTAPQATPSHPAKQAHFATWGHGMRGFSQGSPDMLIRFNW